MQRTLMSGPATPVVLVDSAGTTDVAVRRFTMTWRNVFVVVFKFWVVVNIYFGLAALFWFVVIAAALDSSS